MAINTNNLLNNAEFTGVLQSYKITKSTVKASYSKQGQFEKGDDVVQYTGTINVLTNPTTGQFVTINVRNLQNTYNGDLDATSQALEELSVEGGVDTYAKLKDITKVPTITVKRVGLNDNFYLGKDGEMVENVKIDLGFGKLWMNEPKEEPLFENSVLVNAMIKDIRSEIQNDEETGRALVDIYIPYTFGSEKNGTLVTRAFKTTLVAGVITDEYDGQIEEIDLGAELLDYADEFIGDSFKMGFEMNNYYIEEEKKVEEPQEGGRRLGRRLRDVTPTNRKLVSEMLLTGADLLSVAFEEDDITDALKMREIAKEEAKKRAEERQDTPAKPARGIVRGRGTATTTSTEETSTTTATAGRRRFR